MTIGFLFWLLMILWLVFGLWWNWTPAPPNDRRGFVGNVLLLFVLLFLLGWKVFGFVIQG
jgi:hypothetical protein